MKRVCALVAVVVAVAAGLVVSANAAVSVNLVLASGPIALPGSTITLETYVTSNGGEVDNTLFGAIQYPDALVNPNPAGNSQNIVPGAGWLTGTLLCATTAPFCTAFSQVNPFLGGPMPIGVTNFLIATTTFVIDPSAQWGDVITFSWRTSPSTQRLDWFGLTNAPGVTVTVPEPTTAALLGVGLLGMALASRRRA